MKASENSARFVQFVSMAKRSNESFDLFIERLSRDHGDVFDYVAQNFDVCMVWWLNAKGGQI